MHISMQKKFLVISAVWIIQILSRKYQLTSDSYLRDGAHDLK